MYSTRTVYVQRNSQNHDGEFRYGDRRLDALQTLDRAQCVFYVGTFSKSLLPALRLGYIVAPSWAVPAMVAAKQLADGQSSAMAQATVALLIREGHLARHIRRMQRTYGRRRKVLLHGLHAAFGRWLEPLPSIAGLHLTTRLKGRCGEVTVIARARQEGVAVGALRPYYAARPDMPGLVLGYGMTGENAIVDGLLRLHRAMPVG